MARKRIFSVVVAVAAVCSMAVGAMADDPPNLYLDQLLNFEWTGGGTTDNWQNSANWSAPTFPVGYPYTIPTYPDDPGRAEDPDDIAAGGAVRTLTPLVGADLSGPLASDLTVDIDVTGNVTVASLKMGGTGAAVTTNVTGSGGRLVFENGELNDDETFPGDDNADPIIHPDPIWTFNQGRALIWSTGTAGTGKENQITADIQPNDDVDVEGDRDLHIHGDIYEGAQDYNTYEEMDATSINNLLSNNKWLYIHGDIHVDMYDEDQNPDNDTQDRPFKINETRGVLPPPDPNAPEEELPIEYARHSTVDITGHFVFPDGAAGEAVIELGSHRSQETNDTSGVSTIILHADNTATFDGSIRLNRANVVLDHDGVFGTGSVGTANPPQYVGFNLISTDDDRTIANDIDIAQWQTVKGASGIEGIELIGDHSIKFTGTVQQSNTRGWVNLLPAGKTLTIAGPQYPLEGEDNDDPDRIYTIDGSGKTFVTGGIHNVPPDSTYMDRNGHFRARGTGTIVIDYDETNTADNACDYTGYTWVEGSNLHFNANTDLPPSLFLSRSGAVGVDAGVVSNSTFLTSFNDSTNSSEGTGGIIFETYDNGTVPIFVTYDSGGLMLAASEYTQSLNFNAGDLVNVANMTLAAHETGSTYTGTITPSTSVYVNPNTYMLGGGSGTLTLPNVQLTGSNKLLVTNGGEVRLEGANTYTGATRVAGKYTSSVQPMAVTDRVSFGDEENAEEAITGADVYTPSTLTVTNLADGGTASSVGTSSSAAANLVVQGSTLKYVGSATDTDRLFTVGTTGATIDASGTGELVFSNTGALAIDTAEDRAGGMKQSVAGSSNNEVFGVPAFTHTTLGQILFDTEDLVVGMAIRDVNAVPQLADDDSPLEITEVSAAHVVKVGETDLDADNDDDVDPPTPWEGIPGASTYWRTIEFGPAPARMLTLTGSNTGNNTLAPLVQDAADRDETWTVGTITPTAMALGGAGGNGSVGIRKTGAGTWVMTNDNVYTGETQVQAGTLIINGDQSAATGLTTVSAGATLGGNGTLGGSLVADGTVAPGTSPGTLSVVGDYTQNAGATLEIDIAGLSSFDVLDITGAADVAGLINVVLDGFTPAAMDEFDILLATTLVDSGIALATGGDNGDFNLIVGADMITLQYIGGDLPGDYNDDGSVDAADYTVWRDGLGTIYTEGDYDVWKAHFGETSGAGSGSLSAVGAVPEPSTVCLAVLAFLAVAYGCRRHQ